MTMSTCRFYTMPELEGLRSNKLSFSNVPILRKHNALIWFIDNKLQTLCLLIAEKLVSGF